MLLLLIRRLSCLAALAALGAVSVAAAAYGVADLPDLVSTTNDPGWMADVLVACSTCATGAAGFVLSAGGSLALLTAGRAGAARQPSGRSLATRAAAAHLVPGWWRRLLLAGCGLGLTAVSVPSATGAPAGAADGCPPTRCEASLVGLPLPDLPPARDDHSAVVRRGDTLWGIAASRLPASATDAQVQQAVARIYLANRSVLGPDPDLIFPGTHLTIPGGTP